MVARVLLPCMDYLHGDVTDGQFRAACRYEYARESNILRKAAELLSRDPTAYAGEIGFKIEDQFHCASSFFQPEWGFIWQCPSFPQKQIGPYSNWKKSDDPEYFDYTEKQGDTVVATATGWQTPTRTRAFVYVPDVPGEIGIMPDRTAVDQKTLTRARKTLGNHRRLP